MILNKLYKLKKKRGAVLFIVIAMMTLLVIMATAAYYTARGSYTTVIRNYDFSQVYMSAISVSDMLIDAVTNDTVEDSTGRNNYTALQNALIDDSFSKITAKSSKITSSMTNAEQILTQTANDPEIAGVLDAVEVEITLESKDQPAYDVTGKVMDGVNWAYYRFNTTAYYRGNTISIQDKVIREYGVTSNLPNFNTFFTATGERGDDNDRCVIIAIKNITDNMYFENKYTIFDGKEPNNFSKSIISEGSVFFDQCNIKVTEEYNNWIINGSLFLGQDAATFDLGNNDLVIGGDLVFLNDKKIKARNVYVLGNVYAVSGDKGYVEGNLYVNGGIYSSIPEGSDTDTILDDMKVNYGNQMVSYEEKKRLSEKQNNPWYTPPSDPIVPPVLDLVDKRSGSGNVHVSNGTLTTGWEPSASDTIQLEPDGAAIQITTDNVKNITNQADYDHYTSKQKTLDRVLTLDFNAGYYPEAGNSQAFTIKVDGTDYTAKVTYKKPGSSSDYVVELPYVPDGYVLDLKFDGAQTCHNIDYIIDSEKKGNGQSLPIVLMPNYDRDDYTKKDEHGNTVKVKGFDNKYNAFCWNPNNATTEGGNTNVYTADGSTVDVFLEVGNYVEGTNKLVPYSNTAGMTTAEYFANKKLKVGTYNQIKGKGGSGGIGGQDIQSLTSSYITSMYDDYPTSMSVLKDDFQNQFMLISNVIDTDAVDMSLGGSTFCGYVYSPFATFNNWAGPGSVPVIGGMIVSDYGTNLASYAYAKPDPELIEHLGSAMPSPDSKNASGPSIWYTQGDENKNIGANFIG